METTNIIANSGSEIFYFITLCALSLLTMLIKPCFKKIYMKLSNKLFFNLILGVAMECYLSLTISAILNLSNVINMKITKYSYNGKLNQILSAAFCLC